MMRLIFLLFLTSFLAGPHTGLAAESDPLHLTGSRVRLFVPDTSTAAGRLSSRGLEQTGTVIEVRGDTLLFTADHQSTQTLVPITSLTRLEVSRGKRSHVLAGAGLGFLAGAVVGGVIGYPSAHHAAQTGDDLAYLRVPVGVVLGGEAPPQAQAVACPPQGSPAARPVSWLHEAAQGEGEGRGARPPREEGRQGGDQAGTQAGRQVGEVQLACGPRRMDRQVGPASGDRDGFATSERSRWKRPGDPRNPGNIGQEAPR
jgi:hypothetical protein